eukprot:122382-Chlamydomonas_euryale.AAC.3
MHRKPGGAGRQGCRRQQGHLGHARRGDVQALPGCARPPAAQMRGRVGAGVVESERGGGGVFVRGHEHSLNQGG